ncbi:putative tail fiber protein [uncultured Caudovirales phage]|uniref:Putative tail fiber protein n=1 Tax=uncultured Caudovirales phage TaxID=2100421 RepID=A0A2H4J5A2_9CAUD|nr:putative tail fiber protein [uncultured Caudovirales phage]
MLQRLRDLYASTPVATPPASATVLGGVKLKGDLGGTAETPTVPGLSGKAAVSHTHTVSQVDGLSTALAGKADLVGGKVPAGQLPAIPVSKADVGLGLVDNTSDADKPVSVAQAAALAGKSAVGHSHQLGDVAGLQSFTETVAAELQGKAAVGHTHAVLDVSGLQSVLDGKPDQWEVDALRARSWVQLLVGEGPPFEFDGSTESPVGQLSGDRYLDVGTLKLYKLEAGG